MNRVFSSANCLLSPSSDCLTESPFTFSGALFVAPGQRTGAHNDGQ